MNGHHTAAGAERCMPAPAAAQPEPAPAAPAPAAPAPEKPKPGGVLALLRLAAGPSHDPKTCLPRGSFQGQEDLCEGCRQALLVRISALGQQLGQTESKVVLLCMVRGLQQLACDVPLPLRLRQMLRPFGAPAAVAEARYIGAMGPGLAADLALEEEQEAAHRALWCALMNKKKTPPAEADHGR